MKRLDLDELFGGEGETPLTWVRTTLPPTEMWVQARTARDYLPLGFDIIDYEAPPPGMVGIYRGRTKIRKRGGSTEHVWSPELAALHKQVGRAWDAAHRGLRFGPVWKRLGEAHSWLMNEGRYHKELMRVPRFSEEVMLEEPQGRVAAEIRKIAEGHGGDTRRRLLRWAQGVEDWRFEPPAGDRR